MSHLAWKIVGLIGLTAGAIGAAALGQPVLAASLGGAAVVAAREVLRAGNGKPAKEESDDA